MQNFLLFGSTNHKHRPTVFDMFDEMSGGGHVGCGAQSNKADKVHASFSHQFCLGGALPCNSDNRGV